MASKNQKVGALNRKAAEDLKAKLQVSKLPGSKRRLNKLMKQRGIA